MGITSETVSATELEKIKKEAEEWYEAERLYELFWK